ncbi:MAG: hypothetical protein ABSC76_15585 [Terracidiphilus sp.]
MAEAVAVGTILMSGWPQLLGLESESYSGKWSVVKILDAFAVDRKIRVAGWNLFFIASEVKSIFIGGPGEAKVRRALSRILDKVGARRFNGLEVTGIVTKHFLGVPYTTVSAHSRHVQQGCYLDDFEARQSLRPDEAAR